jgi:hypothetical protein
MFINNKVQPMCKIPIPQFLDSRVPVVSLSADGTVLSVGQGQDPFLSSNSGVAIALRGPDNNWTVPFILTKPTASNLGASIACSADGNFIVAGAPTANSDLGEVFIFSPVGSFIPNNTVVTGSLCVYSQTTIDSALQIAGNIHTNNTILTGTSGNVVACAANLSDRRVKDNIMPLSASSALATIRALKPVTFDWINPEKHATKHSAGFIAQDVEKILPYWVSNASTYDEQPTKILTIKPELYAHLVAALEQLVQRYHEQQKEIDALMRV